MLASAPFPDPSPASMATVEEHNEPSMGDPLARNGSIARSDAIAKLRRAASQREMRSRPPLAQPPGRTDGAPTRGMAAPPMASTSAAVMQDLQPTHIPIPRLHPEQPDGTLHHGVPSSLFGGAMAPALRDAERPDPAAPASSMEPTGLSPMPFLTPMSHLTPLSASPLGHSPSRTPDLDFHEPAAGATPLTPSMPGSRPLSPPTSMRERAVARSPLPSLEQLRARILHEREAAGLQRSTSTSAASQAARAYALKKLLGTSSTDRFFDHSKEGALIGRGAATPSPKLVKPHDASSSEEDEGMASDRPLNLSPRRDRTSLRRSRTIGGLSAMAEAQRKAAFVEGVFLAVPGARSNRLSRARQQMMGVSDANGLREAQAPAVGSPSDDRAPSTVTTMTDASVERSLSQRQIARTEMMRKLSTRGRAAAVRQEEFEPTLQPAFNPTSAQPKFDNSSGFLHAPAGDAESSRSGTTDIVTPPTALPPATHPSPTLPTAIETVPDPEPVPSGRPLAAFGRMADPSTSVAAVPSRSYRDEEFEGILGLPERVSATDLGTIFRNWRSSDGARYGVAEAAAGSSRTDSIPAGPPNATSDPPYAVSSVGADPSTYRTLATVAAPYGSDDEDDEEDEDEDFQGDDEDEDDGFYGLYGSRDDDSEVEDLDDAVVVAPESERAAKIPARGGWTEAAALPEDPQQPERLLAPFSQHRTGSHTPESRQARPAEPRIEGDALQAFPTNHSYGFLGDAVPSTPPMRPSFRHPASVPYDTSPANELEVEDLRQSSVMTISPSGVNVPFHLFDHHPPDSRPDSGTVAAAARSQAPDDWPLSIGSSMTLPSQRASTDAVRSSVGAPVATLDGPRTYGNPRSSVDLATQSKHLESIVKEGSPSDDVGGHSLEVSSNSVPASIGRTDVVEKAASTLPSLRSKPSERLNAILGSSFVQEYADDLDFDSYSKSSVYDAAPIVEQGAATSAGSRMDNSARNDVGDADSGSDSSLSDADNAVREGKGLGSVLHKDRTDDELDERYLRKVDRMAEKLGRLAKANRARGLALQSHEGVAAQSSSAGAPQGASSIQGSVGSASQKQAAFLPGDLQAMPSGTYASERGRVSESNTGTANPNSVNPGDSPQRQEQLLDDFVLQREPSHSKRNAQIQQPLPPAEVPRKMHSHQASIESLISALDAGGALRSPLQRQPDPNRIADAAANIAPEGTARPSLSHAATRPQTDPRAPPKSSASELNGVLSNAKLAPFPGLVTRMRTSSAASQRELHSPAAQVAAGLTRPSFLPEDSRTSSRQHQRHGSTTKAPAVVANDTAPEGGQSREEKANGAKSGGFLTSLRRKASGAFVGSHARTGSREGFWARKGSMKRANAASKTGGSDRQRHVLKIEHPHPDGMPVQIIGPRKHDLEQGSPASISTGDSPDILQSQTPFATNAYGSRFHEDLEDGTADADLSTVTAASAVSSLGPSTAAMMHRYSRILTTEAAPASVPGVSNDAGHDPPRRAVMDEPVFQVISATTIKDRYLFLFSDILVIAKPIAPAANQDGDAAWTKMKGAAVLPDARWTFSVRNLLELSRVKLKLTANSKSPPVKSRSNNATLMAFVNHFSVDAEGAILGLLARTKLPSSTSSIAQLLYQTPEVDRSTLTDYLTHPQKRDLLAAYIAQHRLAGVSIESGLRSLLLELRFPGDVESFETVLVLFAKRWVACNASLVKPSFTAEIASDLVFAIMALNDALHSPTFNSPDPAKTPQPRNAVTPGFFSEPCHNLSKEDFIQVFRQHDPDGVLSDRTLARIYLSIRAEPIAQALESDEPRQTIRVKGGRLPTRLTYGQASEPVTLCIPAADPDLAIRLYAQDTTFEPAILTFGRSREASFTITSKALGPKQIIFVRAGRNARYYSGTELDDRKSGQAGVKDTDDLPLPRSVGVTVERAFMKHTFTITSQGSEGAMRHFMLSFESEEKMHAWYGAISKASSEVTQAAKANAHGLGIQHDVPSSESRTPPLNLRARRAADAIALQVLRDTLIARDDGITPAAAIGPSASGLSRSATVNGPSTSNLRMANPPSSSSSLLPLDRQASTSRHYYASSGAGWHERELLIPPSLAASTEDRSGTSSSLGHAAGAKLGGAGHTKGSSSLSFASLSGEHRKASPLPFAEPGRSKGAFGSDVDGNGSGSHGSNTSKTLPGNTLITICRQNSLLPLVLAHLETSGSNHRA